MSGNITFTMIKPGAVQNEHIGPILTIINDAGFRIVAMKYVKLRTAQAEVFYSVHKGKPFFRDLIKFIASGPVVAAILEKEDAVKDFRKLIGTTDPTKAEEGTIRKLFAKSIEHNAVHGSDSNENAIRECNFFFSYSERFAKDGNCLAV